MCRSCGDRHCLIACCPECAENVGPKDGERGVHEQPERDSRCHDSKIETWPREAERQQQHALQSAQRMRGQAKAWRRKRRNDESFERREEQEPDTDLQQPMALPR